MTDVDHVHLKYRIRVFSLCKGVFGKVCTEAYLRSYLRYGLYRAVRYAQHRLPYPTEKFCKLGTESHTLPRVPVCSQHRTGVPVPVPVPVRGSVQYRTSRYAKYKISNPNKQLGTLGSRSHPVPYPEYWHLTEHTPAGSRYSRQELGALYDERGVAFYCTWLLYGAYSSTT